MRSDTVPDFDTAVARFQALLKMNHYSEDVDVVWVTPEDVLLTGKRFLYVRVPIPGDIGIKARRMYEEGVTQGRGLLMGTVCRMNRSTYGHIWFPKSADEIPQGICPRDGSLKLSVTDKSSSPEGRPIRERVVWTLLKLWYWKKQDLRDFLFSG